MTGFDARTRLRSIKILAPLAENELEGLERELRWMKVKPGEVVVSHLTQGAQVYFIAEGEFRAQMTTAYGRNVAIRTLHAGAHFGEIAALTGAPRSLSVIADTEGLVAECPAEAFKALMRSNADFALEISSGLARNVVLLTDRLFEVAALEMRFRLYGELLRLAREGEPVEGGGVKLRNAPTHEALGAAIGAQREAVTRELRTLANEGLVEQGRREIWIKDVARLKEMMRRRAGLTATQLVDWRF